MARTAQNTRPNSSPYQWRQREYSDHQGNPVILGKVSSGQEFEAPEGKEKHTIQIYSKTPIQAADFENLHNYLSPSLDHSIFIEIYTSTQNDAFACVEHQRREIAYRKRLYADSEQPPNSVPPLIPTFNPNTSLSLHENNPEPSYDTGTCLLLTSDSYRAGGDREERNQLGTGPLFINFTRKLPSKIRDIDLADRVDFDDLTDLPSFAEWGAGVRPEATEIEVFLRKDQHNMYDYVQSMLTRLRMHKTGNDEAGLDYGIDNLVSEQTTWNSQQVRRILDRQRSEALGPVKLGTLSVTKSDNDGITVKNHYSEESDIRYVIFVQFLADIQDPDLLETTGRLFTAHVLSMLDSNKTVQFDFRISGASLSYILPFPKNITVGALYSSEDGSKRRVLPLQPHDIGKLPCETCEEFSVVLDRPEFITEPGVLFVMNNIGPNDDSDRTIRKAEVRRSAGMPEVTRRLAMLALEEKRGWKFKRKVTKEECMSLLGLSLEQYQSALFGLS
ncbi:hypothetical protein N7456_006555 [Penicillium angulare]|uniref:Uncharacterized protein n=1 Tax=Penicillium angulare TaxID=116970 RepID=A0A9W9FI27_9EURO|nr:hypothetical protein N7456_006555 [Penicillium angulare]